VQKKLTVREVDRKKLAKTFMDTETRKEIEKQQKAFDDKREMYED
jgi:hypothetical protein